jgi:eukaryotic-like serine/threonine-protein kinase
MAWTPGQTIRQGKYCVERQLGQGRFGVTYLVANQAAERQVIKTLNDSLLQPLSQSERDRLETMFWQEAVKLSQCRHPHIVRAGEPFKEQNQWCFAMEYVDGTSLAERSQAILPEAEALHYIQQVGAALTVVHQNQLVHRDVKPANIMLRAGKPEAVLIDFGLALDFDHTLTTSRTQETSEGFTALELYSQHTQSVGAYTDVYALAATLYALLTGKTPVSAIKRKLDRVRLAPPKELNSLIIDRTSRMIMQGMELEPGKRPQSVQEWLDALGVREQKPANPAVASVLPTSGVPQRPVNWAIILPAIAAVIAAIGTFLSGSASWLPLIKPSPSPPIVSPTVPPKTP